MAQSKKQHINTGSGDGNPPILANGKANTADELKPSPALTSTESGNTKPVSLSEALSLLQTNCFDLRSMGCEISILARGKRLYVILAVPSDTGSLSIQGGHISISGVPVSDITSTASELPIEKESAA